MTNGDTEMSRINAKKTNQLMKKSADIIIQNNANVDYNFDTARTQYNTFSVMVIDHYNLNEGDIDDLVRARFKFEKEISKKYKFKINKELNDLTQQQLIEHNVPQRLRVAIGLYDLIIGKLCTTTIVIPANPYNQLA